MDGLKCQYCKKYGKDNTLEHLPAKKEYYCKRCEYRFSEDTIHASLPKKVVKKEEKVEKKEEPKKPEIYLSTKKEESKKTKSTK